MEPTVIQNNVSKKLLVVEDESVIGNICRRVLTREGFDVVLAANGNLAIQLLDKHQFDFCLLDIRIPGIDGVEIYKYICQTSPKLAKRVIFMTGDSLTQNILGFVNKAGCQLLEKPFSTEELLAAVKKI
jgi:DNA-binding response OmpR family regulator